MESINEGLAAISDVLKPHQELVAAVATTVTVIQLLSPIT